MDGVFQEEQRALAEIERKINAVASRYEKRAAELSSEIRDFYVLDYDDAMQLKELRSSQSLAQKEAEKYRAYQPAPYFGRIDLDRVEGDSLNTEIHYIGKEGISDYADIIVVDWRTDVGSCYYAPNQKEFRIKGISYVLALRRALNIANGKLVNYKTEYDGESVALEGDVIDPFLLTVLKDKRRQNRLTDIIRTIQGNQNEIIRRPFSESFVVQGCAGSGKTMILLHRLSYLKFNRRDMPLGGVKIITPNRFFDAHINDLSTELGLDTIERFNVEEYYVSLIHRFSSKIAVEARVQSEKTLDADMLTMLYSQQYTDEAFSHYHEYWDGTLTLLNEPRLRLYFLQYQLDYPDTATHTADTVSKLESGIYRITRLIEEAQAKYQASMTRLESIRKELSTLQTEYDQSTIELIAAQAQIISQIGKEVATVADVIRNTDELLSSQRIKRDELLAQKKQDERAASTLSNTLCLWENDFKKYADYDLWIQQDDDASVQIAQVCSHHISIIRDAEQSYRKTPAYNFVKRNGLKKQIISAKEQFADTVRAHIETQIKAIGTQLEVIRIAIASHDANIARIDDSIRAIEKEARTIKNKRSALEECRTLFAVSQMPDTQSELTSGTRKECGYLFASYEEQLLLNRRLLRRMNGFMRTKDDLEAEIRSSKALPEQTNDAKYLLHCADILKRLQIGEIFKNVMQNDLSACYRRYKQIYRKINYRHTLYLKLLYCSLYYSRLMATDHFLNIDEAQDISIVEYRLLRKILGERCVFNLYGDINQSVYCYKGISDWDEIEDITGRNIYVLNENYRNTLQITEFCNNEFGAEVFPIGISGESVKEMTAKDAIKWILDLKKQYPDYRVAILYRHGIKSIYETLSALLTDRHDISWHEVDDHKLSVISVETAKGLEFEAVVAIVDQMSNNEKYISYTRALEHLTVVRDLFNSEYMDDIPNARDDDSGETQSSDGNGGVQPLAPDLLDILADDDLELLRNELTKQGILTLNQFKDLKLWAFMNLHALYSISTRQEICARISKRLQPTTPPSASQVYKLITTDRVYEGKTPADAFVTFCETLAGKYPLKIRSLLGVRYNGHGDVVLSRTNYTGTRIKLTNPYAFVDEKLSVENAVVYGQWLCKMCGETNAPLEMHVPSEDNLDVQPKPPALPDIPLPPLAIKTSLAQNKDYTFCDPIYIEIDGERLYPASSWQQVYLWVLNHLSKHYDDVFENAVQQTYGSIAVMRYPRKLDNGMPIEANYSATGLMQKLAAVAYHCRVDANHIIIAYTKREHGNPVPPKPTPDPKPPVPIPPQPPRRRRNPLVAQVEKLVLDADLDGLSMNALSQQLNLSMAATKAAVAEAMRIVDIDDRLIHEEAFIDWEDSVQKLEEIIEKLLSKNNGYISAAQLYTYAVADLHMFLNDHDIDNERAVYCLAQHLFEKTHYHGKHLSFQMKSHISREGDVSVGSTLDVIKKYAKDHDGFFALDELETYLQSVGIKTGNLRGQMKLYSDPIFLYYTEQTLVASECIGINAEWLASIADALKHLFEDMGDHVVLRDINSYWFSLLPSLPSNHSWTPLFLQSVLRFYSKELQARTICGLDTQAINTLHAMLVSSDSEVQTFADAVAAFIVDDQPVNLIDSGSYRFEAEELRQLLVKRNMIAGSELWGKMPKALCNDERFAWDAAGEYVTVKV